jgi:hypothetical protein
MRLRLALFLLSLPALAQAAAEPPLSSLTLVGPPSIVFKAGRDACDGADVPDASARAFRDATGAVALFGMHYRNRALRGPRRRARRRRRRRRARP